VNRLLRLGILCLVMQSGPGLAAESAGTSEVKQLIELTGGQRQYQQITAIMTRGIQTSFSAGLARALKEHPISPTQRARAKGILDRNFSRFIQAFQQEMQRSMPWENLVRDVYTPVYLKHFTAEELREIIAFYRSPTGQKFAARNPLLVQDASKAVKRKYAEKLQKHASKLTRQTLQQISSELKQLQKEQPPK
jgi:hypothetical protein